MLDLLASITAKELKDALRDKRALLTMFVTPLLFLAALYGAVMLFVSFQEKGEAFVVPVQGAEFAAPLIDWLREEGIESVHVDEDPVALVESQEAEFVLVIDSDFPAQFRDFDDPRLELVYDRSRTTIQGKVMRIKQLIQEWNGRIGSLRLVARGVAPQVANPVLLVDVDIAGEQKRGSQIFGFIPFMLVVLCFVSSIGLAVDMMAGEREKHSLEPLLLNPVPRQLILLGKWLAAIICTAAVIAVTAVILYFMVPLLPLERLGLRYQLTAVDLLQAFAVSVPLVCLATALQLLISIFAKSFKEAQTYIGFLMMLPMAVAYYVLLTDAVADWQMWVPVLGSLTLMEAIFMGEATSATHWFAATGISLLTAVAVAAAVTRQLRRERIIYG
jgi:sodium transport system permease protein